SRSASTPTSVRPKAAWPPDSTISATTRGPASSSMSAHTTAAPSAAKRRSVAAPIPDAPPVTIATLPARRPIPGGISQPAAASEGCDEVRACLPAGPLATSLRLMGILSRLLGTRNGGATLVGDLLEAYRGEAEHAARLRQHALHAHYPQVGDTLRQL